MPIVLRVCVAIDSGATPPLTLAATSAPAAAAATTIAAVDAPTTCSGKPGAIPSASEACTTSKALAPSSISHDNSEQEHRSHRSSPLSDLIRRSKQTISAASVGADTPTCRCGKAQPAAAGHESGPPAWLSIASGRGEEKLGPSQKQPLLEPRTSASRSLRLPGLPHESAPTPTRHRALLWLSMHMTLTTTVKEILEQVQDTVERRMCARVRTNDDHDPTHDASEGDNVQCPFARCISTSCSSDGSGDTMDCDGGSVLQDTNAAKPSASCNGAPTDRFRRAELCLCLQDKDGGYHWVGGTRYFHKTAVLQAPFITEVCLRSNAIFEEERRQQGLEAGQHRPSTRPSSLSTLGSRAPSLPPSLDHSAEDTRNAGDSPERCSRRACRHLRSKDAKPAVASRRAAAPSVASAAAAQHGVVRTPISQAFMRSASKVKFAFVRGVVIPMAVLRRCNPHYASARKHHPHGRTPRQYAVVRVPTEMQEEPLDDSRCSSEAAAASSTAQVNVKETAAHASPHPDALPIRAAPVETSSSSGGKAVRPPASPNSISTPFHRALSAETPLLAAALMPAPSTPTLPSRPAPLDRPCEIAEAADWPNAHPPVFDTSQVSPCRSTVATAASPTPAAGSVCLGTHSTTVDRGSGVNDPLATVDALCVGGIVDVQACEVLAKEEDSARIALATAQQEYTTALAEFNAAVPHSAADSTAAGVCEVQPLHTSLCADAELSSLLQRKIELQRRMEACREAERQCERLTTLVERLEKEVQEGEERRLLLAQQLHRDDSAAFVSSY
ncbi:hypothetical protein JIQ42_07377 [Leishmania sp. Namibia]|uniref:hypothetical protein n=1 Tax=Leishmania sp. Namibia TaxID=2802991 RepID=UPI001B42D98B|nr:hypothetical protein JIQ42_07377 [Leishmania sp. Namibia]